MSFAGSELGQSPPSWLAAALVGDRPQEVLPRVFPACLRVLHPARFPNEHGTDVALSWF